MDRVIFSMLEKYNCKSDEDYKNSLKEIIQEVVLFGLWRAKFFEHAAFYGGTALRILYGLDRFSEDLDFSLLQPNLGFKLSIYHEAIKRELSSFGFNVSVEQKKKTGDSVIQSAFLKAGTREHLIEIGVPNDISRRCHLNENLKVKFEIDIDPPLGFETETEHLLEPLPFWVKTYSKPDLFAGKLHALLCRAWGNRIKGRDWYDFIWYIRQRIPVNLPHLDLRMQQSGHRSLSYPLDKDALHELLTNKITGLDIEKAKLDMLPYIRDPRHIDGWSKPLFLKAAEQIIVK